jgi:deoxycytidylate deaminase
MGVQGPAGATGPSGVSGYEIVSTGFQDIPAGGQSDITASCPAGKRVIGGGFEGNSFAYAYKSFPSSTVAWTIGLRNQNTATTVAARAFAICAST